MKFHCPHCSQRIEADESRAGETGYCPGCQDSFVVPSLKGSVTAPPAALLPSAPYHPPGERGGVDFGRFVLVLALVIAVGFGYEMFRFNESPQQAWRRLTAPAAGVAAMPAPAVNPALTVNATPVVSSPPAEAADPRDHAEAAMDKTVDQAPAVEVVLPAAAQPEPSAQPESTAQPEPPATQPEPPALAALSQPFPSSGNLMPVTIRQNTQMPDLARRRATLAGIAEVHITGAGDPLQDSAINFTSPDAWLFLDNVPPADAQGRFTPRMWVNGVPAAEGSNIRAARYGAGTVFIPHGPDFGAMQVFGFPAASGSSEELRCFVKYGGSGGETIKTAIRSFRLKRGYMATIAGKENGGGPSRNYVAQDDDLEVKTLPPELDGKIRFVRIFPWRWTSKKGVAGNIWQPFKVGWYYNWNISAASSPEVEYVPIKQNRYWPPLGSQDWMKRGATHLLGYNEPDHKDQSNLTVDAAIDAWPDLLATGLRLGSPAVSDGGLGWLYDFMKKADAASLRVDFVAVHYYRAVPPQDAKAAARQFYNFLKDIHERTKRPIWITEWNNGANWTKQPDPSLEQQKEAIREMIKMLDETPFVERYAVYNWVEDCRAVLAKDGSATPAGEVYRDEKSPLSYLQARP